MLQLLQLHAQTELNQYIRDRILIKDQNASTQQATCPRKGTVPILFPTDRFHNIFKIVCIQTKVEQLDKSRIKKGRYSLMIQNAVCWFQNIKSEHIEKDAMGIVRSTPQGHYI